LPQTAVPASNALGLDRLCHLAEAKRLEHSSATRPEPVEAGMRPHAGLRTHAHVVVLIEIGYEV